MKNRGHQNLEDTLDIDAKTVRKVSDANRKKASSNSRQHQATSNKDAQRKPASSGNTQRKPVQNSRQNQSSVAKNNQRRTTSDSTVKRTQPQQTTKKKKKTKRKRIIRAIKRVTVMLLILCMIIGGITALIGKLWSIKSVQIVYDNSAVTTDKNKSQRRYSDKEILALSQTGEGKSYLFCSEKKVSERIEEGLPYISDAVAEKKFPNKLIISVKETKGAFSFVFGTGFVVTDKTGKVLEVTSDANSAKKNTIIKGVVISQANAGENLVFGEEKISEEELNRYRAKIEGVISAVNASGIKKLTEIDLTKTDDIYMNYDGRIKIHVGDGENLVDKLKLAAKTLEAEDKNSSIQTGNLNLTVPKKAYFTPD